MECKGQGKKEKEKEIGICILAAKVITAVLGGLLKGAKSTDGLAWS